MEIDNQTLDDETFHHFELLADAFFENLQRNTYCEFGGWGLDNKRPFGNSLVEPDLAEIVLGDRSEIWNPDEDSEFNEETRRYLLWLYDNLGEFLQKRWLELKGR